MRQLPVRVVWWLALLFCAGVYAGLILGVKTLADVDWGLASRINREVNSATHAPDDNCVDFSKRKLAALIAAGVPAGKIETAGRGEREPLLKTADEVAEPKNRRVEISVR